MGRCALYLGLLAMAASQVLAQEAKPEVPYVPGKVPAFGDLRYVIRYANLTDEFRDFCVKAKINFIHWHGPFCGYTGLPKRESFDKLAAEVKDNVAWAHKNGMMIILYIGPNFSYGDPEKRTIIFEFYDQRWDSYRDYIGPKPEGPLQWTQRGKDGKPRIYKYRGDEGFYFCVNSPAARRYVKGILQIIAETGADGVFYDGPFFQDGCCYCDGCKAAFRRWLPTQVPAAELKERYGVADPAAVEFPDSKENPLHPLWRKFYAWSLMEYFADTKAHARKFNPNFILTGNYWFDGNPYRALRGSAESDELLSKARDVNFCESHYDQGPYTERGRKFSNSIDHQYLVAASNGTPTTLLKTAAKARTPEAQATLTRLCIAEGQANLSQWQFHLLKGPSQQAAIECNAFLAKHAALFRGAERHANVALWVSLDPTYFGLEASTVGMARYLTEIHVPYRMIVDEEFTPETLAQYDTLILSDVPVVSDRQATLVAEHVKRGGRLLLVGECGRYDEHGKDRGEVGVKGLVTFPLAQLPGEAVRREVEKGRVLWLPKMDLPAVPRDGLNAGQWDHAREVEPHVAWLVGPPSAKVQSDNKIELTLMRQPNGDRLIANLVNYEVDLSGKIAEKSDVPIWVMLPEGKTVKKATWLTPDTAEAEKEAPFRIVQPGPHRYVTLVVPSLAIYGIVALDLAPDTQAMSVPPATELIVKGEVLREAASVRLDLSSALVAKCDLTVEGAGQGAAVEGSPWARVFSTPALQGKPGAAVAFPCKAVCEGKDGTKFELSDVFYAKIGAIADFDFLCAPHVDMVTKTNKLTLVVTNRTEEAMTAVPAFTLPPGWTVTPDPSPTQLARGENLEIEFGLEPEANAQPGPYEIAAQITAKAGNREFRSEIKRQMDLPATYDVVTVNRPKGHPVIDGKGDDACWQEATVIKGFRRIEDGSPSACETEVKMLYDGSYLYLLFTCRDPMMDRLAAKHKYNGANIWEDDSIEVYLDANHDHSHYGQIIANANGAYYAPQASPDTCKAERGPDGWTVEMNIPLRQLGPSPKPGDVWGFNLCRTRIGKDGQPTEHSAWVPTGASYHAPRKFGHLLFGK